ncbi:MAG TPA: Hsp70 family protein [Blastocatellia bacterium]|jgi:molecular chaperone DnaK (HSP70)|nr:Hsp70 family protein [Blastocatellia bacterium]
MEASSRFLIGIDLGTTNSAVAYVDSQESSGPTLPKIHTFNVPQLIAEGEVASLPTLPSFLYFPAENEAAAGALKLPWEDRPSTVVGLFAREQGALVPGRQVSSAKSWLSHGAVDRTARILPWAAEQPQQSCSPVEAAAAYIAHIRDAWNHVFASEQSRFERQEIVLTVPASFDEEARELTVEAARAAGIEKLTLLEEPLAAFYAWIAAHYRSLKRHLKDGYLVLICDVGGGTTDLSLIRVRIVDKEVRFERTAIGDHLLLGGDNVDLSLARRVEERLGHPRLTLRQRNALTRQCCSAKERLLNDPELDRVNINIMGSGRSVIGGALSAELTRAEVEQTILDGFLPLTPLNDLPARDRRAGLRELGLPYASEPAITRHLAEFLVKSARADSSAEESDARPSPALARPDAILFNGGFFAPEPMRERVAQAVSNWFHEKGRRWRPKILSNEAPENAVAIGAAYYNHARRAGGIRVSGGAARGYYVGVQTGDRGGRLRAVCVMPRGAEEGTTLDLSGREFSVLANRPVSFTLYSSTTRHDRHGEIIELDEAEAHKHAPLITVLRYGKKSRVAELAVQLAATFTEVGTLELWCNSLKTGHRWRLQFQLRGEGGAADGEGQEPEEEEAEKPRTVISEQAVASAERLARAVFGGSRDFTDGEQVTPEMLVGRLEAALGYGKDAWPMDVIRKLCDVLADVADGRKKSARYEARWLNLFGFCLRPGFGAPVDDWRVTQARKIYMSGLAFPKDVQCQVEWFILWRRVAGGLKSGQQQELYQRYMSMLGIGGKKQVARLNTQIEREGWRLLAGLEHLAATSRVSLGRELLERIKANPGNKSFLWSLGRLGARIPLYGPLNCVVPADTAAEWARALLKLEEMTPDLASALAQLAARTDDPARDISDQLRETLIKRLSSAGMSKDLIESLREYIPPARTDALRIFGESLPEGLRLVG